MSNETTPVCPLTESTGATGGIDGKVCKAPVPSTYSVVAPPTVKAKVPLVVMGEPLTEKPDGTDIATEVTVPPPPPVPLAALVIRP